MGDMGTGKLGKKGTTGTTEGTAIAGTTVIARTAGSDGVATTTITLTMKMTGGTTDGRSGRWFHETTDSPSNDRSTTTPRTPSLTA